MPATVGSIASLVQTLSSSSTLQRVFTGSCPSLLSSTVTAYNYIVIENATSVQATINVYQSVAPNSSYIDSVMTTAVSTPPTRALRRAFLPGLD